MEEQDVKNFILIPIVSFMIVSVAIIALMSVEGLPNYAVAVFMIIALLSPVIALKIMTSKAFSKKKD